jgi:hypothetical protein
MKRILIIFILYLNTQILFSQSNKDLINAYFLKYRLYPISLVDFFIDSRIDKNVKSIKVNINDSIDYELRFTNNKLRKIVFDSTSMILKYGFGKILNVRYLKQDSIYDKTSFIKLFPFSWIFNNGLNYTAIQGFNGVTKIKNLSGLQTFSKTKISYKNGKVSKSKQYDWQPIAQKCYYSGYAKYCYPNDTTVIEEAFDSNDSLALKQTHIFDRNFNILKVNSVIKKRVTGWGIDVTFYAYDGNKTESTTFDYKFDEENNWIERVEYLNDTIRNKTIRVIEYKK